jgi:hypothetical protein
VKQRLDDERDLDASDAAATDQKDVDLARTGVF